MRVVLALLLVLFFNFSFSQDIPRELIIEDLSWAIVKDNKIYSIETFYEDDPYILYNLRDSNGLVEIGHFFRGMPHGKWYKIEDNQIVSVAIYQNGILLEYINIDDAIARRYVKRKDYVIYQTINPKDIVYSNNLNTVTRHRNRLDTFLFSDL